MVKESSPTISVSSWLRRDSLNAVHSFPMPLPHTILRSVLSAEYSNNDSRFRSSPTKYARIGLRIRDSSSMRRITTSDALFSFASTSTASCGGVTSESAIILPVARSCSAQKHGCDWNAGGDDSSDT